MRIERWVYIAGAGLFFLILFPVSVVWAADAKDSSPVLATVNGDKITQADVKAELGLRAKLDPDFKITPQIVSDQLDSFVKRRLLIQEAARRNLAEDAEFAKTMESFREQTLIRVLMEKMKKEYDAASPVSEKEIKDFYDKLGFKMTFDVARRKNQGEINALMADFKKGLPVPWDNQIGPFVYGDIDSDTLEKAFFLAPNQTEIYHTGDYYFLFHVASKLASTPPPLSQMHDKLQGRIRQKKEKLLFEKWLADRKAQARIQMSKERLAEIQ